MIFCKYGCGNVGIKKFKNGEWCCSESRNQCPENRKKNAKGQEGRTHSPETIEKMKIHKRTYKRPNPIETNEICSYGCGEKATHIYQSGNFCCTDDWHRCPESIRKNNERKAIEWSDPDRRQRLSENVKESWEDPKRMEMHYATTIHKMKNDPKTKEKLSKSLKKKFNTSEMKVKLSNVAKERWKSDEYKTNWANAMSPRTGPNKMESNLMTLLNKLFPDEYKFVGDYKVWINGKNPDFICEDKKKIIEFFGNYWHSEEVTGVDKVIHEQERINIFSESGYDVLVIWENDIRNEFILEEKIVGFHNK